MPEFVFRGLVPVTYPETRDALGVHLGTVEPGDVREFDKAPDQWWAPVTSSRDKPAPAAEPGPEPAEDSPQPASRSAKP